jgi:hypothetical protein
MPLGNLANALAVIVEDLLVDGLPTGCILVNPTTQNDTRHKYVSNIVQTSVCDATYK